MNFEITKYERAEPRERERDIRPAKLREREGGGDLEPMSLFTTLSTATIISAATSMGWFFFFFLINHVQVTT